MTNQNTKLKNLKFIKKIKMQKLQFKISRSRRFASLWGRQNSFNVKILNFTLSFCILIFTFLILAASAAYASETSGTIVSGGNNGYAWSDRVGWVNFATTNGNINVADSGIVGHAWSANYGWINMSPANGGVAVAANGALSGYAWGSGLGWVNFSGVTINSSGRFVGTASGVVVGTLTFDCSNCSVTTDYRPQNFRTAVAPTILGGGSGEVGGMKTVSIPPSIEEELAKKQEQIEQEMRKKADMVIDNAVNILDVNSLMVNWGASEAGNIADINNDGAVDIFDFNHLMVYWGEII